MTFRNSVNVKTPTITIRETTLFDVFCHALESGEFRQIRGSLAGVDTQRCAWGVLREVFERAGIPSTPSTLLYVHPRIVEIERRAGRLLGHDGMAAANDAGEPFKVIAAALRRARIDVEAGA